jgi:hypothetical protein
MTMNLPIDTAAALNKNGTIVMMKRIIYFI